MSEVENEPAVEQRAPHPVQHASPPRRSQRGPRGKAVGSREARRSGCRSSPARCRSGQQTTTTTTTAGSLIHDCVLGDHPVNWCQLHIRRHAAARWGAAGGQWCMVGRQAGHEAATVVSPAKHREPKPMLLQVVWQTVYAVTHVCRATVGRMQWPGDGVPMLRMRSAAHTAVQSCPPTCG